MNCNLKEMGIVDLQEAYTKKELSPVEYTKFIFKRLSQSKHLNIINSINEETALEQAKESEKRYGQGAPYSLVDGIPIGLKDIIFTKDFPTSMGCEAYRNFKSGKDAFVVQTLKDAGAVLPAKTNTCQFALGPMGEVCLNGACKNPHNPKHVTGGSSSGSAAAVGGKYLPAALGTDTGGSVRMPCSSCGVVGMKTTFSLISNEGIMPLSVSLDCVGPITRSVKDNAVLLNALIRYNPGDWRMTPPPVINYTSRLEEAIKGRKIVVPVDAFQDDLEENVKEQLLKSLDVFQQLGCKVKDTHIPDVSEYRQAHQKLLCAGGYQAHKDDIVNHRVDIYDQVYSRIMNGIFSADEYITYERMKDDFNKLLLHLLEDCDVMAIPTIPVAATKIGQEEIILNGKTHRVIATYPRFTWIANYSGFPAITIPVGYTDENLPVGLSLIGRPFDEANIYRYAYQLEQAMGVKNPL